MTPHPSHRRAYANFCRCGRTIDGQLEALGGTRIAPRVDVNREDYTAIDSWIDAALLELGTLELRTGAELEGTPAAALWSTGGAPAGADKKKAWGRSRPFMARVTAIESLCSVQSADDKDTGVWVERSAWGMALVLIDCMHIQVGQ